MGNCCSGVKGRLCAVLTFLGCIRAQAAESDVESCRDSKNQEHHVINVKPEPKHPKVEEEIYSKVEKEFDPTEHPLHEVEHRLEDLIKKGVEKLCILISTGSLNPVHEGHVRAFDSAKRTLESEYGFTVAGGFISPSDSSWCTYKEYGCFRNEFRLELVRLAVADIPWLFADPWECSQSSAYDFPDVCRDLIKKVDERFGHGKVQIIYLCGADHASKCGLWRGGKSYGVCVVARPGYPYESKRAGDDVFVCNINEFNASSTEIRAAIDCCDLESVRHKVHPNVFAELERTDEQFIVPNRRPNNDYFN